MPPGIPELRNEIREFLASELTGVPTADRCNSWIRFDADFSRKLGERGWIGMCWPRQYGGHERSSIERYVVLEELLAAGAPVGAHWVADRQFGETLLRYGSEEQRQRYMPGMARGEIYSCIGMSEPNSGSDLASVRTRAEKLPDGRWKINGQKIWTTQAQHCHLITALVRTSPRDEKARHAGLSQFLVDLKTNPGVDVRPIPDLVGDTHFNEVFFENCIVGPEDLLGEEGQGWAQVTGELSLERSGPERYLSSFALFLELLRAASGNPSESLTQLVGKAAADIWTLRQMSLSVAGQLSQGLDPSLEAAIVKDMGNGFEQDLPILVQEAISGDLRLEDASGLADALALLLQVSPSFSLRGGTREILRGIIARGLGLR